MDASTIWIIVLCSLVLLLVLKLSRTSTQSTSTEERRSLLQRTGTPVPTPSLSQATQKLFTSGKYSDITVVCGKRKWKLHKSILCTQSDYFAKACDGSFHEAQKGIIPLKEDDECAVAAMLYYFYHADYSNDRIKPSATSAALLHVMVYMIADKYILEDLRAVAVKKLSGELGTSWKTKDFSYAIAHVYAFTPSSDEGEMHELREVVVAATRKHATELFASGKDYAEFKKMAWSTSEFAADVARATLEPSGHTAVPEQPEQQPISRRYRCPRCSCSFTATIRDREVYSHTCVAPTSYASPNSMLGAQWQSQWLIGYG
ncbi:hypothetical protein LTR36_007558 [Oleoguttula mirabilis]|uniref:BTB domain-containing protein n=1 Tax=Oleoguttula mirabilis TaxID=1507867 RepID=A0AAV9JTY9_9PEZI|nr:hypothetical protein LTR36_007558 [Oleoguttula mirabilis]